MEIALTVLKKFLLITALMLPFYGFVLWVASMVLSRVPVMAFTSPKAFGDGHPMLQLKPIVRYLGGEKYPLPHKFGIFHAWPMVALLPGFSIYNSLQNYGFSWLASTAAMAGVQLLCLIPVLVLFRWLQPRWLKRHLATLPPDATSPEAVDSIPSSPAPRATSA